MDLGASVRKLTLGALAASSFLVSVGATPAAAQAAQKPNILVIMGDDIGWMQPSIYASGLGNGETPNIDRLGNEGMKLHRLLRHAELHLRAHGLHHRHVSAACRHDSAAASRQPVVSASRHAGDLAVFLRDLGYTTGEFGKNHLGDHTAPYPQRTASRSTGAGSITWTPCSR